LHNFSKLFCEGSKAAKMSMELGLKNCGGEEDASGKMSPE
jgi:hypothetical protein